MHTFILWKNLDHACHILTIIIISILAVNATTSFNSTIQVANGQDNQHSFKFIEYLLLKIVSPLSQFSAPQNATYSSVSGLLQHLGNECVSELGQMGADLANAEINVGRQFAPGSWEQKLPKDLSSLHLEMAKAAIDFSGKFPPVSINSGNTFAQGAYTECLSLTPRMTYTLAVVDFSVYNKYLAPMFKAYKNAMPLLLWIPGASYYAGWCLPSVCNPCDVRRLTDHTIQLLLDAPIVQAIIKTYNTSSSTINAKVLNLAMEGVQPPPPTDLISLGRKNIRVFRVLGYLVDPGFTYFQTGGDDMTCDAEHMDTVKRHYAKTKQFDLVLGVSFFGIALCALLLGYTYEIWYSRRYPEQISTTGSNTWRWAVCLAECFAPLRNTGKIFYGANASKPNPIGTPRFSATSKWSFSSHAPQNTLSVSGDKQKDAASFRFGSPENRGEINAASNHYHDIHSDRSPRQLSKSSSMHLKPNPYSFFHGIRALSMLHIILGHTYVFAMFFVSNFEDIMKHIKGPFYEHGPALESLMNAGYGGIAKFLNPLKYDYFVFFIYSGFFAVDTFFFLSGFFRAVTIPLPLLPAKLHKDDKELVTKESTCDALMRPIKRYWLKPLAYRYMRLTPLYVAIMIAEVTIVPYMGSGPFWSSQGVDPDCRTDWWVNLLYLNNFPVSKLFGTRPENANPDRQHYFASCAPWTWYLACDMQFHWIAPLLLWVILKSATYPPFYSRLALSQKSVQQKVTKNGLSDPTPTHGNRNNYDKDSGDDVKNNHVSNNQSNSNTINSTLQISDPAAVHKINYIALGLTTGVGLLATLISAFVIAYIYNHRFLAFFDTVDVIKFFFEYYIRPYIRIPPFYIGLLLGTIITLKTTSHGKSNTPNHDTSTNKNLKISVTPKIPRIITHLKRHEKGLIYFTSTAFALTSIAIYYTYDKWDYARYIRRTEGELVTLMSKFGQSIEPMLTRALHNRYLQRLSHFYEVNKVNILEAAFLSISRFIWPILMAVWVVILLQYDTIKRALDGARGAYLTDDHRAAGRGHNDVLDLLKHTCFYILYVPLYLITGAVGLLKDLLSHPVWIPVSNLSYSAYFIHPVLMLMVGLNLKHPIHFSHLNILTYYVFYVVTSYVLAFFFSLTFEYPYMNLAKILFDCK